MPPMRTYFHAVALSPTLPPRVWLTYLSTGNAPELNAGRFNVSTEEGQGRQGVPGRRISPCMGQTDPSVVAACGSVTIGPKGRPWRATLASTTVLGAAPVAHGSHGGIRRIRWS